MKILQVDKSMSKCTFFTFVSTTVNFINDKLPYLINSSKGRGHQIMNTYDSEALA